jgi:RNA polymerase sigma-70 factor (ECF subfamily)
VKDDFEDKSSKDAYDLYLTKVKETHVKDAIESLARAYREVIVLRVFEDLSYCEIARVLGCPIGTVMSRLGRERGVN